LHSQQQQQQQQQCRHHCFKIFTVVAFKVFVDLPPRARHSGAFGELFANGSGGFQWASDGKLRGDESAARAPSELQGMQMKTEKKAKEDEKSKQESVKARIKNMPQ
jgi:hypothetical protein